MTEEKEKSPKLSSPPYPNWKKGFLWGLLWGGIGGIIFFALGGLVQRCSYDDFSASRHLKNSTICGLAGFFICLIVFGIVISFKPEIKKPLKNSTVYILDWYGSCFIISFFLHIFALSEYRFSMDTNTFFAIHIITGLSVVVPLIANASYLIRMLKTKVKWKGIFKGDTLSLLETHPFFKYILNVLFVYVIIQFFLMKYLDDFINTSALFSAFWMFFYMFGGQLLYSAFNRKKSKPNSIPHGSLYIDVFTLKLGGVFQYITDFSRATPRW